jgi:hypothetical protein
MKKDLLMNVKFYILIFPKMSQYGMTRQNHRIVCWFHFLPRLVFKMYGMKCGIIMHYRKKSVLKKMYDQNLKK